MNSADPGWVKADLGADAAPLEIPECVKTGVELALLGEDGPSGGYFHPGKRAPRQHPKRLKFYSCAAGARI